MNIVIYNTNSYGGNYEYSRCLAKAYDDNSSITSVKVLVPFSERDASDPMFHRLLLTDKAGFNNKALKIAYFFYRSIANPLRVFRFLKKEASSVVIFNDYDQLTSFIWVPLFKKLKKKHRFCVILHDPDRDNYLPSKMLSTTTMKRVMSLMDIAFYHEHLPIKSYYKNELMRVNVPHGIYHHADFDKNFLEYLKLQKGDDQYISILGNIREEKNYEMILECLPFIPNVKLLIVGKLANSNVSVTTYRKLIADLKLEQRVVLIEKFMTDDEFQSAILCTDVLLLYYKESFTSQSGVLNLIAPHKKRIIVSDTPSALKETINKHKFGEVVALDKQEFIKAVNKIVVNDSSDYVAGWENYMKAASWARHVALAVGEFKNFNII